MSAVDKQGRFPARYVKSQLWDLLFIISNSTDTES